MTRRFLASPLRLALAALAAAALCGSTATASILIPTSLGNGADSMLARDESGNGGPFSGDNTLGGGTNMQVRSGDATGRNRLGIVRFAPPSLAVVNPAGARIDFHETGNNGRAITVYGLNDGDVGEGWDEATITYNTAPGISFNNSAAPLLTTDFDPARLTNLGTLMTTASTDEVVSFSGAAMEAFIAADTNSLLTFYLYQPGSNGNVVFTTKEGGRAPALVLVPAPTAGLLLGLAGVALAAVRRRR